MLPLRLRLPRPLVTGLVTALLALHAWLAVSATIDLGVTGDETVHLTGGYSYWRFNDYRLHPENGNLPQRWAALPLLVSKPRLEPESQPEPWQRSDVWQIGQNFFFESGNSIDYLLLCARSMSALWSVATGLLVFLWSRSLWSENGGLFSLVLYTVSPTILAHGALVTSDMCAAFFLLAATGAWWRLTERFTLTRLVLSLAATACAAVAKFSFVLLVPVFILISVSRLLRPENITVIETAPEVRRWRVWAKRVANHLSFAIAHIGFAALVVWGCFGFRFGAFSNGLPVASHFFAPTEHILAQSGIMRGLMQWAFEHEVGPQAFLHGFTYVLYAARERGSFLAGEYGSTGWWWFFPFAFAVKSTVAELLTAACLLVSTPLRWLRHRTDFFGSVVPTFPLLIFALVYGTVSLTSHLNIGQRHIIPLYPVLFILAGALAQLGHRINSTGTQESPARPVQAPETFTWRLPWIAVLIAVVQVVESTSIRPNYLAFFNQAAGGPDNGWTLLGDSSLDWGQNLPKLAEWLQENRRPGEAVYISNFGADDPFYRGIKGTELAPYYSFERELTWARLQPGLYCVGTSMLQDASSAFRGPWSRPREEFYQRLKNTVEREIESGLRSPEFGVRISDDTELITLDRARFARLCMYLRARAPEARIGHSIHVYRLTADEVRRAVDGTLDELIGAIQRTAGTATSRQLPQPSQ